MSYLVRLKREKNELDSKITNLWNFVESERFKSLTTLNQILLIEQHKIMKSYSNILEKRISLANK